MVRVIVFVPRSRSRVGRLLHDPVRLAVRRFFIKKFLSSDAARLDGAHYNPHGLIDQDRDLIEYFAWLAGVAHGIPHLPGAGGTAAESTADPADMPGPEYHAQWLASP
jgi:hypothetical protein